MALKPPLVLNLALNLDQILAPVVVALKLPQALNLDQLTVLVPKQPQALSLDRLMVPKQPRVLNLVRNLVQ
jgi:hypothetical protein